jgi:hypothetical protein
LKDILAHYESRKARLKSAEAADTKHDDPTSENNASTLEEDPAPSTEAFPAIETHNSHPQLDDLFNGRLSAQVQTKGTELYSDLSEIIHRYKGDKYELNATQFGAITADIMRALIPICVNEDGVDWSEELLRYQLFVRPAKVKTKRTPPGDIDASDRNLEVVPALAISVKVPKERIAGFEKFAVRLNAIEAYLGKSNPTWNEEEGNGGRDEVSTVFDH